MKLRYLYVDRGQQLRTVSRETVYDVWEGRRSVQRLCPSLQTELRLVTLVCGQRLNPKKIYLMRLPLIEGQFTVESYLTLQMFSQPEHVTAKEAFDHHTTGWPRDFFTQLAVVMDVPRNTLEVPIGIGGPLFLAAALRISPQQAVRYLR